MAWPQPLEQLSVESRRSWSANPCPSGSSTCPQGCTYAQVPTGIYCLRRGVQRRGQGENVRARYVLPLPALTNYTHNLIIGMDYKDFENLTSQLTNGSKAGSNSTNPPVTYVPLSFAYTSFLSDPHGVTQFSSGLNMAFRGLISDEIRRPKPVRCERGLPISHRQRAADPGPVCGDQIVCQSGWPGFRCSAHQ